MTLLQITPPTSPMKIGDTFTITLPPPTRWVRLLTFLRLRKPYERVLTLTITAQSTGSEP